MEPIITLLTDFGLQDGYAAAMKGVVLGIAPRARIVDMSHLIPPQDIRWGAYVLRSCYAHFPPGTVHVAVVDPGVGTDRRAVALRAGGHLFMGPDNGLFSFVLEMEKTAEARLLENPAFFRPKISSTFHGRDIFAPTAAHLASGAAFESLGPPVQPLTAEWARPQVTPDAIRGEVLGCDRFGNIVTNIQHGHLAEFAGKDAFQVFLEDRRIPVFASTYGELPPGHPLALLGSSDHLEIALNQGSAADFYKARAGQKVRVVRAG